MKGTCIWFVASNMCMSTMMRQQTFLGQLLTKLQSDDPATAKQVRHSDIVDILCVFIYRIFASLDILFVFIALQVTQLISSKNSRISL